MRYSSILAVTFTALVMINGSDSQKTIDQMLQDLKEAGKERNPCDKLKVSPVPTCEHNVYLSLPCDSGLIFGSFNIF